MSITIYAASAVLVFIFSGLLAMAGLGAAFLFVPLFYYLGVPLAEATPTALLLNVVSLLFATINYWRGKLINWRMGLPVLIAAVILSPVGALMTRNVNKTVLLAMFLEFRLNKEERKGREVRTRLAQWRIIESWTNTIHDPPKSTLPI
jgi:uncharacterized membrane protein YfcA